MTALTEAHLKKLPDEDLRTLALRIVNDAVSALDTYIDEHDLTDQPNLDPAPVHRAAAWLREILTNPDDGYDPDTLERHHRAVNAFVFAAWGIGESTTGSGDESPLPLNANAVGQILDSLYPGCGTPHRPWAAALNYAFAGCGGGFIPGHETTVGYVLKALCDSDDPRLPALAESYMQSGLQANLRPAINRATRQLSRLDDLTELNR